ncbi:hypothetical protein GCM10012275_43420 [Longimycelium tulufanense]|uniref:Uncharacterized protein n=1 Tax=Longimycelium tulufanense TaxID=907463 RepID=A0A8J3CH13_9PSEU|nr:hypothetical protein [Longimycelium tulufanense]GGM68210.1 hypothetical protein GCM10012275_43420 [Longimycelium tulufanense]
MTGNDLVPCCWTPHDGERHAYRGDPRGHGVTVMSLCCRVIVIRHYPPTAKERHWPECRDCAHRARDLVAEHEMRGLIRSIDVELPAFGLDGGHLAGGCRPASPR